ncbi:MAG: thrombospondin type 3 repeat-containing protein [Kiritimatiellae bacterium]|nr:thrombospondin type 3 repeat-containing protein [Kiritimatiellia bacterium]
MKIKAIIAILIMAFAMNVQAQGPAWWFARGAVDTNLPANDYALVTLGQLKWMATNACAEMQEYFDPGASVTTLVFGFANSNNYYLANIGQVKYVVQPFYDRLHALNLTNTFPANMPGYYPWGNGPTNDYALAVIGQVKYVFSFDSAVDTDGDGLADWREAGLGTDPYDWDSDDDGLSDGDEVNLYGTDPTKWDTDGDGFSDKWELDNGFDPLDASDGNQVLSLWLEDARDQIVAQWNRIYTTPLVFTNTPGSAADLTDLKNALLGLSNISNSSGEDS